MAGNWSKLGELAPSEITPMVRQYLQAKAECPDSLLFFRMGDFYELFFEDALEASELLGLTLTSRDGAEKESRVPMCGVPVRAVDAYVARVIRAGRTVTICDQMEDPRAAKGIVKREVVRTVTPGTVMEPELLDERANNYLGAFALSPEGADGGLALLDVTTGEVLAAALDGAPERTLHDEITRMAPAELLHPDDADPELLARLRRRFPDITLTARAADRFDPDLAGDLVMNTFGLGTLKGVGLDDTPAALGCLGAALAYVRETQRDGVPRLRLPRRYSPSGYVVLDGNTQRNLELVATLSGGGRKGSLLGVLDRTLTSMGGRRLRHWLLHPLVAVDGIRERLDAVEELVTGVETRMALRDLLRGVADLERLTGRITSKAGNARDVRALGASLERVPELRALLGDAAPELLRRLRGEMDPLGDVTAQINRALVDDPPLSLTEGGVIRDGFHPELDRLRGLVRGGRDWIATLQREERERTGIAKLKVGYNKIFGYYLEVSRGQAGQVPPEYQRKQTLVNAERYVTPALKEREEEMLTAQERMQTLENELFCELRAAVSAEARRIQQTAEALAVLDCLLSLAEVAATRAYCRPEVGDFGELVIRDGRHPVVEDLMKSGEFVPNDTILDPQNAAMLIVTGPNMAGKSTYLRQVALITLMAQTGSFVPAASARVGVVDRIFTRVGASDNLVRGESTFMVEMIETAAILNSATDKSLLVLDEIGRGTSTFDGISIAWSVAEHLHDQLRAKTLFATHYHELTELGTKLEHAKNVNVAVREWNGRVVFLYRIADGGADHSYGIQVAQLAGLPAPVIDRARAILESLEAGNPAPAGLPEQLWLFGPPQDTGPSPVEVELSKIDPDTLSPRDAQNLIYHLKHLANKPRKGGKSGKT
ncbi:MAG: DNA mismatch repair protein MutS [Candidatus Hydrogenedens sp.]|nr:DNA mismatch repair protein MutS [Candidatus Hydrogenedens sp.]